MCRAPSEKNVVKHVNFSHILLKMHTVYWSYNDTWAWETLVDIISADTEGVASWTEYMVLTQNSTTYQTFVSCYVAQ